MKQKIEKIANVVTTGKFGQTQQKWNEGIVLVSTISGIKTLECLFIFDLVALDIVNHIFLDTD